MIFKMTIDLPMMQVMTIRAISNRIKINPKTFPDVNKALVCSKMLAIQIPVSLIPTAANKVETSHQAA